MYKQTETIPVSSRSLLAVEGRVLGKAEQLYAGIRLGRTSSLKLARAAFRAEQIKLRLDQLLHECRVTTFVGMVRQCQLSISSP